MLKKPLLLICACLAFLMPELDAQFSWRVGYNVGLTGNDAFNDVVKRYQANTADYDQPLKELTVLDGFVFGIRVKYFELYWSSKNRLFEADSGPDNNGRAPESLQLDVKQNSVVLSGAYPFYQKEAWTIEAGGSLDYTYNLARVRRNEEIDWQDSGSNNGLSSHLFVNLIWRVARPISLSVSPYVQMPWFKTNLYALQTQLDPAGASQFNESDFEERVYLNYGLALGIYAHF